MPKALDERSLNAFFKEIEEQLHLILQFRPDNPHFPIQVENPENEITKLQCNRLMEFIQSQVDLRENEIAKILASKKAGNVIINITEKAAQKLSEVYGLSFFHDIETDED